MLDDLQGYLINPRFRQLIDIRNVGLYIFAFLVVATTWSGVRTVQSNYDLQRKVDRLQQENEIYQLQKDTSALQNKYLESDQYTELTLRGQFGMAAPGEKLITIPKAVALKYVSTSTAAKAGEPKPAIHKSKIQQNLEDWRDFLTGRGLPTKD